MGARDFQNAADIEALIGGKTLNLAYQLGGPFSVDLTALTPGASVMRILGPTTGTVLVTLPPLQSACTVWIFKGGALVMPFDLTIVAQPGEQIDGNGDGYVITLPQPDPPRAGGALFLPTSDAGGWVLLASTFPVYT